MYFVNRTWTVYLTTLCNILQTKTVYYSLFVKQIVTHYYYGTAQNYTADYQQRFAGRSKNTCREISKISMITPEEETTLASASKWVNQKALDKLFQAQSCFVVSVAKRYQHQGCH